MKGLELDSDCALTFALAASLVAVSSELRGGAPAWTLP